MKKHRTLNLSIGSLALGYTVHQFYSFLSLIAQSLLRNLFWLSLLSLTFFLYRLYYLLNHYHFLKLSYVLRKKRKLLIFSIIDLNFFKVYLVLIFGFLKIIQVLQNEVFVCLFKLLYFCRLFTESFDFILNFFVKLISLSG